MASTKLAMPRRWHLGGSHQHVRLTSTRTTFIITPGPWVCQTCCGPKSTFVRFYSSQPPSPKSGRIPKFNAAVDPLHLFPKRHIGPRADDTTAMLAVLDPPASSMNEFVSQVIPSDILSPKPMVTGVIKVPKGDVTTGDPLPEDLVLAVLDRHASDIPSYYPLIGQGYYETIVPPVIQRNVLENPAWYTSYTPYQPEISQGRLESLLNFQTMVSDLTGLPIANASLLDEGTAAAEAMTLSLNSLPASRLKRTDKVYVVSHLVHPQTISVLRGRAEGFDVVIQVLNVCDPVGQRAIEALGDSLVGILVQYPDTKGGVEDFRNLVDIAHKQKTLLTAATDLLALTILTPPGEWGADIAVGSAQRLGVPMGRGGPHAAFFAVKDTYKRRMPGRLVGVSKDRLGGHALRLSLQTREQHIRREKATSNVCTAQALLANMNAMYAVYHGPEGLKRIALGLMRAARVVQDLAEHFGYPTYTQQLDSGGKVLFDTVCIKLPDRESADKLLHEAYKNDLSVRKVSQLEIGLSMGERVASMDTSILGKIARTFASASSKQYQREDVENLLSSLIEKASPESVVESIPDAVRRTSDYLTHPVFNSHHSETEMLRYIHHLASKDLSLVHSMIPLGSCTMKLNGTTEMKTLINAIGTEHPYLSRSSASKPSRISDELMQQLASITGMDFVSLQPNSGAQGEFAGLRVIRKYHEQQPGSKRDICLIPVSAHGTNPASAAMAGMRVVPVKCDATTGNLDIADLEAKCEKHADELGAIMITYPSTYGVFEPEIKKVCQIVHQHGGLVYMDGANMTAQIGLCSPGEIGADVCHLNLHKTFCIPHGGGGPGVGPICVKQHLKKYLPGIAPDSRQPMVSSAPLGSYSILPISWAYIKLMGSEGLKQATEVGLLNANYLLARLKPHYKILYTNQHGRCAHEFILDARPFKATAGIEAIDIAKRLQDYGFHAPTMSWPVANTLMIEPTESESKEELDRFADALIAIREEIREVEEGRQPREGNVLRMAPHPQVDLILGDGEGEWDRPYSRATAAYPLPWLKEKKFWPTVARVDDAYGDTHLFCTCPPVEDTTKPE